jgi:probable phosphoglycerate mutase
MKHLFIVRHGQTQWNVDGRMQGRMDSPLTELGKQHATSNGALLRALGGVDLLWSSPSGRTTETAHIINSYTQTRIEYADELMERDCGAWSGLTIAEIENEFPEAWSARSMDPYWHAPPDGENLNDMHARVSRFLEELFGYDLHSIGLITHGVMSKVILKFFLGLSEVECTRVRHPNDLVYRLTFHAQDIDTHHFRAGGDAQEGLLRLNPALETHPISN